jgi:hypothetical protein
MVLSKRERYIVFGAALVLGGLALDRVVLGPLLEGWSATEVQRQALLAEMNRATATLRHSKELAPKWRAMVRSGIRDDPAEAESQALHAIRNWTEESGVALSLLKPDRLTERTRLPEISFQASCNGSMDSISKLLWRVRNATIPVRITELQLATRKEGTDDLSIQLRLSTVYRPETARAGPPGPASGPTGARR